MLKMVLTFSLVLFAISILMFMIRAFIGPSVPDRVIAMDTIGINLLSIMAILSVLQETRAFFGAILLFGMLAFIGTVAFSKFIERGLLPDDDNDR